MSVISMMEMNAKSPYLWDWENLVMFNTKSVVETPKKLQLVDSKIEGIEEGFEIGSLYSSGGTGSDLGYASSSRSSKSASVDSSTNPVRIRIRSRSEASGESIVALELGKRTYFEDVSAANKSKKATLNTETPPPLCQVEGCNLDLSSAKDYHRKHRVCESHSKSSKVVINGLERRFCQQCSRFHSLSEFDQKKRSCRRRLSDHNARRRKPKPEIIQFNSMKLASSLYEGRNQLSFGFKQGPVIHTRHGDWDSTNNSKVEQPKSGLFTNIKTGVTDELHSTQNGVQNPETKVSPVSTHFLPSKGSSSQVFQQGLPVSMDATQDLRALSLLSTSSWGSCDTQPSPLHHSLHTNQPSLSQPLPVMHAMSLVGPSVSSEYWQPEQPVTSGPVSHSSTFQLFKAPDEPSYYLY